MRDTQNPVQTQSAAPRRGGTLIVFSSITLLFLTLTSGCAAPNGPREKLAAAYTQLDGPNPDTAQIIAASDEYLQANPNGPAAADALYLHGRALEAQAAHDVSNAARDSADAYNYYSQALTQKPRPALEGLIHVGMGNILYFQDRYAAALTEFTTGYEKLERDNDKAWTLYRMGLCAQRLGNWSQADRDFAAVQQTYPNTVQAQRAREHQGATNFWVQAGTYANPTMAESATNDLKKQGLPAQRFQDNARHVQYVRVGPFTNYETAAGTRQKILPKYRDAIIIP
jgi:outer membrane protein assembly factor BamD (BamD/ComL family)